MLLHVFSFDWQFTNCKDVVFGQFVNAVAQLVLQSGAAGVVDWVGEQVPLTIVIPGGHAGGGTGRQESVQTVKLVLQFATVRGHVCAVVTQLSKQGMIGIETPSHRTAQTS